MTPTAKPTKKRLAALVGGVVIIVVFVVFVVGVTCAPLQRQLDRRGLQENAQAMLADPLLPPPPARLEYLLGDVLEVESAPERDLAKFAIDARNEWKVEVIDGKSVTNEMLRFPSSVRKEDSEVANAAFFVYRQGELGERPVILWLPGYGFADYAWPLFEGMYEDILRRGYDLLVWVPPYHMSRQRPGVAAGVGLLRVDSGDNLRVLNAMVQEIRTAAFFLESRGVKRIGAWGGSVGGAVLWMTSSVYPFDHINLMVPVLDWRTFIGDPEVMGPVINRLEGVGYTPELFRRVVWKSSPIAYKTLVRPERIQVQYARYDQVTDEQTTLAFARERSIEHITGYNRSHGTVLLTPALFDDYNAFLDEMAHEMAPPR